MYHFVGKNVRSLHIKTSAQFPTGECVESMMSFKGIECPGIAVLDEQNLLLVPMMGKPLKIKLAEIGNLRLSAGLPGKGLIKKQGFVLDTPGQKKVAFAVPRGIGRRWLPRLGRPVN